MAHKINRSKIPTLVLQGNMHQLDERKISQRTLFSSNQKFWRMLVAYKGEIGPEKFPLGQFLCPIRTCVRCRQLKGFLGQSIVSGDNAARIRSITTGCDMGHVGGYIQKENAVFRSFQKLNFRVFGKKTSYKTYNA